jgi:hypothetical protein
VPGAFISSIFDLKILPKYIYSVVNIYTIIIFMRKGYIAIAILGVALSAVSLFLLLRTNAPSEHMPLNEDVAAMELAFINYIAKHQKAYATKDEYHERKEIFKATMRKV